MFISVETNILFGYLEFHPNGNEHQQTKCFGVETPHVLCKQQNWPLLFVTLPSLGITVILYRNA